MRLSTILFVSLVNLVPLVDHAQLVGDERNASTTDVPVDENGCYHGLVKEYFQNGNLKKSVTYVNGYVYGEAKFYFRSGELKRSGFLDGTNSQTFHWFRWVPSEYGIWIRWHKDGTRKSEIHASEIIPQAERSISNPICK